MLQRKSKRILYSNGLTDSENNSDNENQNNATLPKKGKIIGSESPESEAEKIEANNSYYGIWTSKRFFPKIHKFAWKNLGI